MITTSLNIETNDGTCDAFAAYPSSAGAYPGILFFMDAFGLRPYLKSMVEKLAAQGYFVLAPNILYRQGKAPIPDLSFPLAAEQMPAIREKIIPLVRGLKPDEAMADAKTFLDFLTQQPQVNPKARFGATGYCMGGAMRAAARFPAIAAVASFHAGHLATDAADSPHLELKNARCEFYIANADQDASMPPQQIERLKTALDHSGAKYEMETLHGAAHGFTMADLPMYNAQALERHWQKLFALFARTLK